MGEQINLITRPIWHVSKRFYRTWCQEEAASRVINKSQENQILSFLHPTFYSECKREVYNCSGGTARDLSLWACP